MSGRTRTTALRASLVAVLSMVCAAASGQHSTPIAASRNAAAELPAPGSIRFSWTRSLPVTYEDPSIGTLGGTELRAIVSLGGKLYAANDYWHDSETNDSRLPGPQIYR